MKRKWTKEEVNEARHQLGFQLEMAGVGTKEIISFEFIDFQCQLNAARKEIEEAAELLKWAKKAIENAGYDSPKIDTWLARNAQDPQ